MLEELLLESLDLFTNLLRKRIEIYGKEFLYLSQESLIAFLYVYSLVYNKPELINRVFLDYPFIKQAGLRGRIDLYIDIDPGYYMEVKYIRPIPSGRNLPLTRYRGYVINDVIRLAYKIPARANKYLLLVASKEFIAYMSKKPGFPFQQGFWHGKVGDLIITSTERNAILKEKGNRRYLDQIVDLRLLKHEILHWLHIVLWKIAV